MRYGLAGAGTIGLLLCLQSAPVSAAESGLGSYLLGSRSNGAGITPPPGVYFQDDTYFYDAKIGGGKSLPFGGLLVGNVSTQTWLNLPTTLWVTPAKILGGDLAFSLTSSVGDPRVNASLLVNSPRFGPIGFNATDDNTRMSDFFVQSFIGWQVANFHWQLGISGIVPSGSYVAGELSNASLNRPGVDVFGTFTWLDPAIGWDLSTAVGFTFNQTNTATDYKTGDEFHLEWAATKYLSKQFTIGLVGYYYQQFTPDTGTGAVLGAFEGRVAALGGSIGYTFEIGQLPVSTRLKVYREFDAVNHLEGTSGYLTVSVPLGLDASVASIDTGRSIKAKF
jgi:hypothetical protein